VMPSIERGKVGIRRGKMMASMDEIRITVQGKGGHGAQPQENRDPVITASMIIVALQQVISRNSDPRIPSVLSFGKVSANGTTNIIPDLVYIEGTFRTLDEQWRGKAHGIIKEMATSVALGLGCTCEIDIRRGFPSLYNHENLTDKVKKEILNMIFYEDLSKGERLPSIAEMADLLSVSKATVREAIRGLEQIHFLEVKQGKGVFLAVDPKSLGKNVSQLRSVTEMAQESGIKLETLRWYTKDVRADTFLADKLEVQEGTPLVFLSRVRGFEEEVAVYLEDIIPKELVYDFTSLDWEGSLFEALEKRGI